jgi:hypothetical protein
VEKLPAREWDARLTARGVTIQEATVAPGRVFWRVVRGQWFNEQAAGGRHHIYVEALDEAGRPLADVPFRVNWPSGAMLAATNGRAGFDAGNYPMSPSRNEFAVKMADNSPSDLVAGIGMGQDTPSGFNPGAHTVTVMMFRRMVATSTMEIPESEPDPTTVAVPASKAALNPRVMGAVFAAEATQPFDAEGRMTIRFEAHIFLGRARMTDYAKACEATVFDAKLPEFGRYSRLLRVVCAGA